MPDGYVMYEATYFGEAASGKAIQVGVAGGTHWIPNFAIHEDSEVYKGSAHKKGTIFIREDIAEEKGIAEPNSTSGGTGVGIPLKRHRLPDPPGLMADKRLFAIETRLSMCSAQKAPWKADGDLVRSAPHGSEGTVGMWEQEVDATFAAHAPDDVADLVYEVKVLREWVAKALKTQERRKRK